MDYKRAYLECEIRPLWRCNLNCPDCSVGMLDKSQTLSWEAFLDFVVSFDRQHIPIRCIEFTGGEPTLWDCFQDVPNAVPTSIQLRVLTNAIHREPEFYKGYNTIRVSDYGGINHNSILKLKRAMGKRVRISMPVHRAVVDVKGDPEQCLPAECTCVRTYLCPDGKIYACGRRAALGIDGLSPSDDWYERLCGMNVLNTSLCTTCQANAKIENDRAPFVVQIGVWNTSLVWIVELWSCWSLRNRLARWYMRHI
jgi:hypothetical protein